MIKKSSDELKELTENPLASSEDKDSYDKYICLLLSIEEFITHITLMKSQLNEEIDYINQKLQYSIIPKENFREYLISKLTPFQKILEEYNTDVKNKCLRLLLINVIDYIKVNSDYSIEISFK